MAQTVVMEAASGVKDGVNVDFETTATYITTSLRVFLNGQLLPTDNVIELGGKKFKLDAAPVADDILSVHYTSVV